MTVTSSRPPPSQPGRREGHRPHCPLPMRVRDDDPADGGAPNSSLGVRGCCLGGVMGGQWKVPGSRPLVLPPHQQHKGRDQGVVAPDRKLRASGYKPGGSSVPPNGRRTPERWPERAEAGEGPDVMRKWFPAPFHICLCRPSRVVLVGKSPTYLWFPPRPGNP